MIVLLCVPPGMDVRALAPYVAGIRRVMQRNPFWTHYGELLTREDREAHATCSAIAYLGYGVVRLEEADMYYVTHSIERPVRVIRKRRR